MCACVRVCVRACVRVRAGVFVNHTNCMCFSQVGRGLAVMYGGTTAPTTDALMAPHV